MKNSGGTGFWHETYFRRGGIEAVYLDAPENIGLMAFAPVVPARRPMFGAAARAEKEFPERPVLSEEELYGEPETAWNHQLGDSPLRGVFKAVNPKTLRGKRRGWMQSAIGQIPHSGEGRGKYFS